MDTAIRVTRRYSASPERVFHAWLDPEIAGRWLFATATCPLAHVDIHARVAGSFCFVYRRYGERITYSGEYTEIVPHRRLGFTLATDHHADIVTRVAVEVAPRKKGSALTLIHDDVPPDNASQTKGRWIGILHGLGETLDSDEFSRATTPATKEKMPCNTC
jgi:uncharacterized protein YndB with AHSA1/START domain